MLSPKGEIHSKAKLSQISDSGTSDTFDSNSARHQNVPSKTVSANAGHAKFCTHCGW
jgi:hypothetical protein